MDEQQESIWLSKALSEGNLSLIFQKDEGKELDLDQSLSDGSQGSPLLESGMNNGTTPIRPNMAIPSASTTSPTGLAILGAFPQFASNRSSPSLMSLSSVSPPKFHLHELGPKQPPNPSEISTSELFIGATGYNDRLEAPDHLVK
jgi:hypothetical protein